MGDNGNSRWVIGDILKQVKRQVKLEDNKRYKLLGVQWYGKGMFLREEKLGKDIKADKLYRVHTGDFVYNRLFAWKYSFAIVESALDGCLVSNEFPTFECDPRKVDPYFLLTYVLQPTYIDFVNRQSGGMSSISRKRFKEEIFLNSPFPNYTPDQQRTISASIKNHKGNLTDLALTLDGQTDLLKQLRQAVLQEAIEGKLTAEWRKQNPKLISGENHASKLLERIRAEKDKLIKEGKIRKEKPLPPITNSDKPFDLLDGWVWCRLGDICSKIGSGSTPKGSNYSTKGIPFFRSQNIHDEGLKYDDIKFISVDVHKHMDGTLVVANDLLLNITGGSLGRCALVPKEFDEGNVSQHVCIIRRIFISEVFLHKLVLSPLFQKMVFGATTGAGREGLPKYNLEQFVIPLPPLSEQQAIIERVGKLLAMVDQLEKQVSDRKEQSELLMQSVLREAFEHCHE
jgi:type I restriction enzyme S subunit